MVHRACKLARACVPAVEPVAFTTDVRPNITGVGYDTLRAADVTAVNKYVSGAIYSKTRTTAASAVSYSSIINNDNGGCLRFDASRSSSTYGTSTVQPSSVRLVHCIKT